MVYKPPTPNVVIVNAKYCYINNSCFFFKSTINSIDLQYTPWVNNSMSRAFSRILPLTLVTNINNNVTNMDATFSRCSALENAPIIPNSVVSMVETFHLCSSLINVTLPNSVSNISGIFNQCSSLINAPNIPNSVTDMSGAFNSCSNIITAPIIPESVTNISMAFIACSNLRGDIYIKSTNIENCEEFVLGSSYIINVWAKPNTLTWNSLINAGYTTEGGTYSNVFLKEWNNAA